VDVCKPLGGGGGCVEIVTPDGKVEKYEDVIMAGAHTRPLLSST